MSSLQIRFTGWQNLTQQWKTWEERLRGKFEHLWRNAGILEAIKASTYQIQRSNALVLGLAQKWNSETNTFMFSWGEAAITLEDMMVFGGYSLMGSSVFTPLEDEESKQMEQKLIEVRASMVNSPAKKADHAPWLRHFMEEEGELEHTAFLSLWLSRFVFPRSISKEVFPIAINLARGNTIALAPAVLASIYRDLTLLKLKTRESANNNKPIFLRAPFQLVQIWAFERFPSLHLKPNMTEHTQPIIAKWYKVKMLKFKNVSLALDSCGAEGFIWQPYKDIPKFYNEKDKLVCFDSDSPQDLESFARCLRHCELVGMNCVEKYLPHLVSKQFGLDQHILQWVAHCDEIDPMIDWRNYDRPMTETLLCIASSVALSSTLEPSVTFEYFEWLKKSKLGWEDQPGTNSKATTISGKMSQASNEMRSPILRDQTEDSDPDGGLTIEEMQKRYHSYESYISMEDGDENLVDVENMNVVRGSERGKLDVKIEDVIGKFEKANEGKLGGDDDEGESVSDCSLDVLFSHFETRIENLENVVAKLKAAKFGHKYVDFRAKAGLS